MTWSLLLIIISLNVACGQCTVVWGILHANVNFFLFAVLIWLSFFLTNCCHLRGSDYWLSFPSSTADMCNSLVMSV